jgi:tetratricopeptide (TPR) repeat protein
MNPSSQLLLEQAIHAFQTGHIDRADSILKKILLTDNKNLTALHLLGLIRATQSNFKEATDLLSKAALIDPQDAFIQYNLAKALVDSGDIKGSIPHHKMTVELSPHNPDAWLNYGKTVSNLKQHEEAISYYDKAISLNPNYAEAWSNKGISLRELKRYEEAITHYEKALSLNPNNPEAWGNKALTLESIGDHSQSAI